MISRDDYEELHKVADEKHILLTVIDDTVKVYWDNPREIITVKDKLLSLGLGIQDKGSIKLKGWLIKMALLIESVLYFIFYCLFN